jgi:protein TonB
MAYLVEECGRRMKALAGVAAVHALLGYALVSGLASRVVDAFVPPPIKATNVPETALPDELPPPPVQRLEDVRVAVKAPVFEIDIEGPNRRTDDVLAREPAAGATGLSQGPVIDAIAKPLPVPPVPLLRPAAALGATVALTSDDYPDASRRAGEEGAMRVRVDVGVDGRVGGCAVESSTGFARLDAKACQVAQRRWRFAPATEDGKPVASVVVKSVRWRLEDRR